MPKIVVASPAAGATLLAHAAANSTDTHASDKPKPQSGGGGK